jgi:sulfite exporter TauE/SafE
MIFEQLLNPQFWNDLLSPLANAVPEHAHHSRTLTTEFTHSYLVALVMGLFSSMHCLGMCGSIIGTLTLSLDKTIRQKKSRLIPFIFSYNLGRISSYMLAGLLVGFAESLLTMPLGEGHGHRYLQIFSALIMVGAGLHIAGLFPRFAYLEKLGVKIWRFIHPVTRRFIPIKTLRQSLFFGMIWGWLPCGLVYTALALAATTGDVTRSALTMLAFGIGTLPAVFSVGIMTNLMTKLSRVKFFRWFAGLLLIVLAGFAIQPDLIPLKMH